MHELPPKPITFLYTNYRGVTNKRLVLPIKTWYGKTDYHPDPQWFLRAWDIGKADTRDFALKDISEWGVSVQ